MKRQQKVYSLTAQEINNKGNKVVKTLKAFIFFLLFTGHLFFPDAAIYEDSKFAIKIDLFENWNIELKKDDEYYFRDTLPGKKTRLHLKKYSIDSSYGFETMQWTLYSFAINKSLAEKNGKVIFSDTSISKRLGDLRAFELFSFFSQVVENKNVCWAEYARWTEKNGTGYYVSIIGDTTELKTEFNKYKALMDNIQIWPPDNPESLKKSNDRNFIKHKPENIYETKWVNLMGKKVNEKKGYTGIIINSSMQQKIMKPKFSR